MIAVLERVRGEARRQLLLVTTLYFGILFLESSVGHVPFMAANWLTLLPIVVLPLSLIALVAVFLKPSASTEVFLRFMMVVAAAIGVVGIFPHLAANGVTWSKLGPLLNGAVFHGEPGPTWPLAIAFGALMGFSGSFGLASDREFAQAVWHRPFAWLDKIAFLLLIAAIALAASIGTLGWACTAIVAASILLLLELLAALSSVLRRKDTK